MSDYALGPLPPYRTGIDQGALLAYAPPIDKPPLLWQLGQAYADMPVRQNTGQPQVPLSAVPAGNLPAELSMRDRIAQRMVGLPALGALPRLYGGG